MVRQGLCWRIGNGESVKIWKDPWIPDTQSRQIISPVGESNVYVEVAALIDPITPSWKEDLVGELLLPFEQARILRIPLS